MEKIQTIKLEDKLYNLGFKVVTENLESLGLRRNPNILKYEMGDWYSLEKEKIQKNSEDFGGIWVARTLSGAKSLRKYMKRKYAQDTRIFKTAFEEVLYANSYRIKTNKVNLLEEIF